ncbi:MAG: hypothetical protein KU38_01725 [Sulfurovum sp. FS08-3]|nr:MAG: hypothetical protein KU38_01725 [Sulfurovum sp. FS08-3]
MNLHIVPKNIKHIYIRIKPSGEVVLSVPLRTSQHTIDRVLHDRSHWIEQKLRGMESKYPTQSQYMEGDRLFFLGEAYTLHLVASHQRRVELEGNHLYLFGSSDTKAKILEQWYKNQAKHYFEQTIATYHPFINRPICAVRIKKMKTRWGSCNPAKGYINLNLELIKKPLEALEYVVLHELAHLIYPHHGKDFYALIAKQMPDWKQRAALLK